MTYLNELKDENLKYVSGGANMLVSKENNNITIFMDTGNSSVNKLFAETECIFLKLGGTGFLVASNTIRATLHKHQDKITKCIIDINTYIPTYYVNDIAYSQTQIDQGILNL